MASSLAFKRLVSSNLIPSYFSPFRPSVAASQSAASRLFNANAARYSSDVDRRSDRYSVPSATDVFGTNPAAGSRGIGQGWAAKEADDGMDLPAGGLGKEHVKVNFVEQNTPLVLKGEGKEEDEPMYASRIEKLSKLDEIKAEKVKKRSRVLEYLIEFTLFVIFTDLF